MNAKKILKAAAEVVFRYVPLLLVAKAAAVEIHPEPGDLSAVVGLQRSELFQVEVGSRSSFVYHGAEPEFNKYGFARKGGHFTSFGIAYGASAVIEVVTKLPIERFQVLPLVVSHDRVDAHRLRLEIRGPTRFLLTVWMGGEEQWLVVSADEPETLIPDKHDPEVLFLGPGVHHRPRAWDPFVEGIRTVYLAPGAVLEATIRSVGKDGITLRGRGILAQAKWKNGKLESPLAAEWMAGYMGMHFRDCSNVSIEGIAVINCPSYQLELADCEQVHVRNVKLLGFGEGNNDGMHLYGRHIRVEDSWIAGSDDRICLTGLFDREKFEVTSADQLQARLEDTDVHNLHIRNVIFWGHKNGGDIMITWNGGKTCTDILIEDCKSLGLTNKGFLSAKHGGSVVAENIVIRNVELFHPRLVSIEVKEASCWGAGGGAIRNVLVEHVKIHADPSQVDLQILGHDETSDVSGITFRNIRANGVRLRSIEETSIRTNAFVKGVVFE
jgi:hypothetical protein